MEQHLTHVSAQLAKKDKQIAELQSTIAEMKELVAKLSNEREEKNKQVLSFLNPARCLHMQTLATAITNRDLRLPPMEFTATFPKTLWNWESRSVHPSVYGPSFYTHPFGCKLLIRFDCFCSFRRDALMHLFSCEGEYDSLQLWPVNCTITAQILRYAGEVKEYNDWEVKLSLNRSGGAYLLTGTGSGCDCRALEIQNYHFSRRQYDYENRYLIVKIDVK